MSNQNSFNSFSVNSKSLANSNIIDRLISTGNYDLGIVDRNSVEQETVNFSEIASVNQFGSPTNPTSPDNPTTTIVPPIDPGFDLATAYDLGVINGSLNIQETVGSSDRGDIYQFTVNSAGEYSFALDGLSADAHMGILDSDGNLIVASENSGTVGELLSGTLSEGTYYLSVISADGVATNYNLNITNGSSPTAPTNPTNPTTSPTQDPGDPFDTAYDLGIFNASGSIELQDAVGSSDPVDAYQFSINQTNAFSFTLDGLSADVDLGIFDSNGELLASSENVLSGKLSPSLKSFKL